MTWDRWLPVFSDYLLDRGLASSSGLEGLRATARRFPQHCLGAIEVRLNRESLVDLSCRLDQPCDAGAVSGMMRPETTRFLDAWRSGLVPGVPAVWLEFDQAATPSAPVAWACVGRNEPAWALDTLVPFLCGPSPIDKAAAQRLLEAVSSEVRLLYVGDLTARGVAAVRFEFYSESYDALVELMRRTTDTDLVHRALELRPIVVAGERFHLSIDIECSGVTPVFGVEVGFARQPSQEGRWRCVLDQLVDRQLCSVRSREAILDWEGIDSLWSVPSRWPVGTEATSGHAVRCLSHVKIQSRPADQRAKAYLLFQHLPRSQRLSVGSQG